MAWTAPRTWAASEIPTSSNMNIHIRDNELALADRIQIVRKPSDESVTSNTTPQNDDHLLFAAVAGQAYKFMFALWVSSTVATGDLKLLPVTTGVGTLVWGVHGTDLAATTGTGSAVMSGRDSGTSGTSVSVAAVNGTLMVFLSGTFSCTSSGNVVLQWAQDTSSATATTIKAGSYVEAVRVAV